jgi:hypothetical protein
MPLNPDMILFWLDKFHDDYQVLKFILNADEKHDKQTWAVLNHLPREETSALFDKLAVPGSQFEIYTELIAGKPQPIPELKLFSRKIQKAFSSHPCWVRWAAMFDRPLTSEQRKVLAHYRVAFLCLLAHGWTEKSDEILSLAARPMASKTNLITGEFLYSRDVLRDTLNLNLN